MPQNLIHYQYLNINDSDINRFSLASSGTAYTTQPIHTRGNTGYSALLFTFYTGTALINSLSYQVSVDKQNWFTAATTDGTALTAVGAIAGTVTASQYVVFTPRPAEWTRFTMTATSTGTWSMQYLQQEYGN